VERILTIAEEFVLTLLRTLFINACKPKEIRLTSR